MIHQKHWLTCLWNSWVFRLPCHTWLRQCHWMLYCQTRLFWRTTSWCSYVRLPCRTSGQSQQLFLWCKNSYSYDARIVIFMVQEQLFLWCKNSYFYGTRTVIIVMQEQLFLWCKNNCCYIPPFFIVLDISVTLLSHIFRSFFSSFRHILKKNRSYGQLWTLMDSYGHFGLLWFSIFALCKVGDMRALFSH